MSALVRIGDGTPMHLCSVCPDPGSCCNNFYLTGGSFWLKTWREDAHAFLDLQDLPFTPRGVGQVVKDPDTELEYCSVLFGCDHVTPAGRCGIYDHRPDLCRRFTPGTDGLCCFGNREKV